MNTHMFETCYDMVLEVGCYLEKENENGNEYASVDIIAKYDVIKELSEEFIRAGHDFGCCFNLNPVESDGYNKEYVLTVDDFSIAVEPMWRNANEYHEAGYINVGGDATYVHGDCNSDVLSCIFDYGNVVEFGLCDYDGCENCSFENADACEGCLDDDDDDDVTAMKYFEIYNGDIDGFTNIKVSTNLNLTKEDVKEMFQFLK